MRQSVQNILWSLRGNDVGVLWCLPHDCPRFGPQAVGLFQPEIRPGTNEHLASGQFQGCIKSGLAPVQNVGIVPIARHVPSSVAVGTLWATWLAATIPGVPSVSCPRYFAVFAHFNLA